MSGVVFAIGLWIVAMAVLFAAWFVTQTAFLSAYRQRFSGFTSATDNALDVVRNPAGLLRRAPGEWRRKFSAQMSRIDDPVLERRRVRALRLYAAFAICAFGGLPAALLLVALAERVGSALGIK